MKSAKGVFDPTALDTEDLGLFLCCRDIARVPKIASPNSALARVQEAVGANDYPAAIEALRKHLAQSGVAVDHDGPFDRVRFRRLRDLAEMSQKELGFALSLSPSAICQYEKNDAPIKFSKLVVAAEVLGVPLTQLYMDLPLAPHKPIDLFGENSRAITGQRRGESA